eukprot:5860395-Pyramimonas_sp.AAC.1
MEPLVAQRWPSKRSWGVRNGPDTDQHSPQSPRLFPRSAPQLLATTLNAPQAASTRPTFASQTSEDASKSTECPRGQGRLLESSNTSEGSVTPESAR